MCLYPLSVCPLVVSFLEGARVDPSFAQVLAEFNRLSEPALRALILAQQAESQGE